MGKLLLINSSISGDNSVSRQLAGELIERLQAAAGTLELVHRDFSQDH